MILFYIPCGSRQEAASIAKHLLEKSFIACANSIPADSFWKDQDEIKESQESILIVKTTKDLAPFLRAEVEKIHSYDTPCIIEMDVRVNKKYNEWLLSELQEV